MIKSLHLKNFRKVRDETMVFTPGLNVLKGANESSKTTRLEAIAYCLFGSKVLRTPLSETVTWGEKESSLKATLVINVEGKDYTFSRSKGGASVNSGDMLLVTGQGEVTDFASNLLGADAKTAAMLMLSSQSGLRGALDDGPAAVSALMGKLADFDLIDRIIGAAQTHLLLGSDEPLRERLAQAEAELKVLPIPDPQIWMGHEERRAKAQATLVEFQAKLTNEVQPAWQKTLDALSAATATNTQRRLLLDKVDDLERSFITVRAQYADALGRARRVPTDLMAAAVAAVEAFRNHQKVAETRDAIRALGAYPEVFWEGSKDEFDSEVADLRSAIKSHNEAIQGSKGQIQALRRQLIKGGKCPTCGHDAGNDDHVKEHNAKIEAEIKLYQAHVDQHTENERLKSLDLKGMEDLERRARPWVAAASRYKGDANVKVDESFFPPRVEWVGGDVDFSGGNAERDLKKLQDEDRAAVKAEGEVEAHLKRIAELQEKSAETKAAADKIVEIDLTPLQAASNEAFEAFRRLQDHINVTQEVVNDATLERDRAKEACEQALNKKEALLVRIQELEADIKSVAFNNTLLKKLRAAKPLITDHLWNTVLSAVSNFFSQLRGENSVVSKDTSGFKVNGQNVESLSGSTLDVLALAIRVALTKTFIPHASFLVLDEPAHGCDAVRTGNVLGFLASAGFSQTLLASHDELSEAVADKVVALES